MKISQLAVIVSGSILPLCGCVFIRHQMILQMKAQQEANARLSMIVVACVIALPLALWAGLVWGTKTISLRSWWVLLTVECILLAILALGKNHLLWVP